MAATIGSAAKILQRVLNALLKPLFCPLDPGAPKPEWLKHLSKSDALMAATPIRMVHFAACWLKPKPMDGVTMPMSALPAEKKP
jgi:hypothetical protein